MDPMLGQFAIIILIVVTLYDLYLLGNILDFIENKWKVKLYLIQESIALTSNFVYGTE